MTDEELRLKTAELLMEAYRRGFSDAPKHVPDGFVLMGREALKEVLRVLVKLQPSYYPGKDGLDSEKENQDRGHAIGILQSALSE